jgi:hypothetical protein
VQKITFGQWPLIHPFDPDSRDRDNENGEKLKVQFKKKPSLEGLPLYINIRGKYVESIWNSIKNI